jgi:hypothetical protein
MESKWLFVLIIVSVISVASYAATVSVTTVTYQAQYGLQYNITSNFSATDQGFTTVPATAAASAQPCTWATGGTCRNAQTVAHFRYSVLLTLNVVPGATTTYTVTVNWDQGSGSVLMCSLTVSVTTAAVVGQTMTIRCDTGSASFTTPLAVDVTVA